MYRAFEQLVTSYFDPGYPVDIDPFICKAIDEYGKSGKKILIVLDKVHDTQALSINVSIDEIVHRLKYYVDRDTAKCLIDATWLSNPRTGTFVSISKMDGCTVEIRILNLYESELKYITESLNGKDVI